MTTTRSTILRRTVAVIAAVLFLAAGCAIPADAHPALDPPPHHAHHHHGHAHDVTPTSGAANLRHGPDNKSVDRLYHAYFKRAPDAGGLAYWHQRRAEGMPLSHLSQHFASSAEFRATYGHLDNAGFVTLVYRNVLDREPDPNGFAHWTGVLAEGRLSRGGVMIGFSDSPEFKASTGLYEGARGAPDPRPGPGGSAGGGGGGGGAAPAPPAPAPTVPANSYAFYYSDPSGVPARWDPCSPIDVVLNLSEAPHIRPIVEEAVAEMTRVTGVEWRILGDTSEEFWVDAEGRFSPRDIDEVVDLYGERWPPVLLTIPERYDDVSSVARGGPDLILANEEGRPVILTGRVALRRSAGHGASAEDIRRVVLHELAHVFGLEHPAAPGQIMSVHGPRVDTWGAGDLEGFRQLGPDAGCLSVPDLYRP